MEKALELYNGYSYGYQRYLAILYQQAGQRDKARALYLEMLERRDVHPSHRKRARAQILNQATDPDEAARLAAWLREDVARLKKRQGSARALAVRYELIGVLEEEAANLESARAAYLEAERLAPGRQEYSGDVRRVEIAMEALRSQAGAILGDETAALKRRDPFDRDTWWVAAQGAVIAVAPSSSRVWSELLGRKDFAPAGIVFDAQRVWLGTDRGLFVYTREPGYWSLYSSEHIPLGAPVSGLRVREGSLEVTFAAGKRKRRAMIELGPEAGPEAAKPEQAP
jgi:tetratricopeptide (TPR) repeat protein